MKHLGRDLTEIWTRLCRFLHGFPTDSRIFVLHGFRKSDIGLFSTKLVLKRDRYVFNLNLSARNHSRTARVRQVHPPGRSTAALAERSAGLSFSRRLRRWVFQRFHLWSSKSTLAKRLILYTR
jgi:hypothetical protein